MDRFSGLAACTVVSRNHVAYARVVCESFLRHHPGASFFVLLADRVEGDFSPARESFELIELEGLGVTALPRFTFQYDVLELNCAAKPYLMRHALQRPGVSKLLYLDSDTYVYRELSEALDLLERHSILLTPHLVGQAKEDGLKPGERDIMESGVYNAGFLGLRQGPDVDHFLDWWSRRVYDRCIRDTQQGLFVDQRWLDLVPGLFEGVHVLRHPGYNVGHWGLTHRRLEPHDGGMRVNGQPLSLFHFSGLDLESPETISRYQDRFSLDDVPALRPLLLEYVARVKAAGHAEVQRWPYAYGRFGNGVPIPRDARRLYWSLGDAALRFDDPFDTRGPASFWHWLREDAAPGSGISRLWHHAYSTRPDLQRAFPDVFGTDRGAFLSWVVATGRYEHAVPEALVPAGPPFGEKARPHRSRVPGDALPGVCVTSDAAAAEGTGEVVQALVRGLAAAGAPHTIDDGRDPGPGERCPVNLIHVDAEGLPRFVRARGPLAFRGKYNIAFWPGELRELPEAFRGSFAYVDEVWVTSSASLEAISRLSPVPVVRVPLESPEAAGARIRERLTHAARLLDAAG